MVIYCGDKQLASPARWCITHHGLVYCAHRGWAGRMVPAIALVGYVERSNNRA